MTSALWLNAFDQPYDPPYDPRPAINAWRTGNVSEATTELWENP
jgi:hypothetical protein